MAKIQQESSNPGTHALVPLSQMPGVFPSPPDNSVVRTRRLYRDPTAIGKAGAPDCCGGKTATLPPTGARHTTGRGSLQTATTLSPSVSRGTTRALPPLSHYYRRRQSGAR